MASTEKTNSHLNTLASTACSQQVAGLAQAARAHISAADEPEGGTAAAEALINAALTFAQAGRDYINA